jgi:hypothetical protein
MCGGIAMCVIQSKVSTASSPALDGKGGYDLIPTRARSRDPESDDEVLPSSAPNALPPISEASYQGGEDEEGEEDEEAEEASQAERV